MEGVAMKRKGTKNLALEVPGLAEKRPSLVHGDHVFVKLASGNGGPRTIFQAYINCVEADEVLLTFTEEFHISHMNRNLYDVQFAYSRVNMRRLYHVVYATTNVEAHLLFPTRLTKRRLLKPTPFVPFTCNLNKEQRHCVEMILDCHGAPTFAIYGPPGTETADLNETDIGVITPYHQQVLKIRQVLEAYGFHDIKVGSVEQFQGQEKEVIIVSTVRSTIKHNDFDKIYCLRFLSNPRRCNVAITRAKSLHIIVENPHIVCQDPYWDKLLKYCMDNNSYLGCRPPEREDDEEQDLAKAGVDNEVQDSYSKVDEWCYSVQDEGTSEVPCPVSGGWN
ncbi:hypothetical protein ACFE04_020796 [Oxalis oulophora]